MGNVKISPNLPLRAGTMIAFNFDADGTLSKTVDKAVTNPGTVASIERTHSVETKELPDGNSQYPMTIRDIKTNDRVKINFSSFQPQIYAMFAGETIEEQQDVTMSIIEEKRTIDGDDFTIKLEPSYDDTGMLLVTGIDSTVFEFEKETNPPAAGQFSISADALIFNSADAGKEVFLSYDYTAPNAVVSSASTKPKRPAVHMIIGTEVASQPGDVNIYRSNIVVDKCRAVGDLKPPDQKTDADGWSLEVQVLEPRGGQSPIKTITDQTPTT